MRISSISTAVIEANFDWTIVKIGTDEGVTGLGECFFGPGLTAVIGELAPLLVGRRCEGVEPQIRRLQRLLIPTAASGGLIYHALAGIETALWDLNAKALGVPLWRLLGGPYRSDVRVYADCHAGDALESYSSVTVPRSPFWDSDVREDSDEYDPAAYVARAKDMAARGFRTLKFDIDLPLEDGADRWNRRVSSRQAAAQIEIITAVVEAVPDVDVAFDCHWQMLTTDAVRLARAVERLPVLWLEDPVPPDDLAGLALVTEATSTPIASGENLYVLADFADLIESRAVDVVAPDPQKVCGLSDMKRIAAIAEARNLPIAPHNIAGPIGTLANAHLCASVPNFLALEWHAASVPFFDDLVVGRDGPLIVDGHISLSGAPGIGAELDVEQCRRYARPGEPFFDL